MKVLSLFLLVTILLCSCSKGIYKKNNNDDTAKKGMTIEELINSDPNWVMVKDSVIINGSIGTEYENKKTKQVIIVTYD